MSPGKAAAQAGHAILDSFLASSPDITAAYVGGDGTKVILHASEPDLRRAHAMAQAQGIPTALIVDNGHQEQPDFDGVTPVLTACGIGPVKRSIARPFLRRLSLMK
jgi:peptidyl-tRNA hydrolase